ncbi:MAG: peptidoglycan recognition family protein [Myxococcota bacterium]
MSRLTQLLVSAAALSALAADAGTPAARTRDGFDRLTALAEFKALPRSTHTVRWKNPNGREETLKLVLLPIPVDDAIREKTLAYMKKNYGRDSLWLDPRMVVLHSMDLGDVEQSLEASSFLHDEMPDWGDLRQAGLLPNGAHFIVDRDGTIYCLTPPLGEDGRTLAFDSEHHRWMVRRHQDGNPTAIGIENATPINKDFTDLTPKQVEANAKLVRWLIAFEHGAIRYVVGHHQMVDPAMLDRMEATIGVRFRGPGATTVRSDPGQAVVDAVVKGVRRAGFSVTSDFVP